MPERRQSSLASASNINLVALHCNVCFKGFVTIYVFYCSEIWQRQFSSHDLIVVVLLTFDIFLI